MSRSEVSTLLRSNAHNIPNNTYIISIRNTDQYRLHKDCDGLLNLCFDDVLENDERKMTEAQAIQVVAFAKEAYEKNYNLIVHCHGGVSRSAGMGAAIAEGLSKEYGANLEEVSYEIWHSHKYIPNEYVYALVCKFFGIEYSKEEIKKKLHEHAEQWFTRCDE